MSSQIREVRKIDLLTYSILPPIFIVLIWTLGLYLINYFPEFIPLWCIYVVYGLITYVLFKRFVIGVVLLYKAFAPMEVREKCRFEPTCSTYMIIAIKKYGLVYGVIKGIRRLLRCKPPNGGIDYP